MKQHLIVSFRMTAVLLVLTCGIYPAVVWAVAQLAFPRQANGSFREHGSDLIGQRFTSPRFFHSRPSAPAYDATASGGTNLGPTSQKLRDAVESAVKSFDMHTDVPADAVTSSGPGLDPHISPANADAQASRVARENGLTLAGVRELIAGQTEGRFAGVFGEPRINVLRLNLAVAEAARR